MDDTMKDVTRMPERIRVAIGNAIAKSALTVERYAKTNAPVDTGRLRSSIITDMTPSIFPTRATITPFVNYAIFIQEGTRYINANPFLTRARDQAEDEVHGFFDDALDTSLK